MTSLPPLSCNAHCHVFGARDKYPYDAKEKPPLADFPKESLYALNNRLGLERCVIVQSKMHGFDNAATEDAVISRLKTYRGVALLPTNVDDKELVRLEKNGFRAVRFNYMAHLGAGEPIENVIALAKRLKQLNWHLQIHGSPKEVLYDVLPKLLGCDIPIVIDHIGRINAGEGEKGADFQQLCKLMKHENCWVKVSGIDRITAIGAPYTDAIPLARHFVETYPTRVLWGNDAPHPNHQELNVNDDLLAKSIFDIAPTAELVSKMMVDNPSRLYRF